MSRMRLQTVMTFCLLAAGMPGLGVAAAEVDPAFRNLPAGCYVTRSIDVPADQVQAISNNLGATAKKISNTYLNIQGSEIQVNIILGRTDADAKAIYQVIAGMKGDPAFCLRDGKRVIEYVGNDPAVAIKTSYEVGFLPKPKHVRYRLTADLATVDKIDYMKTNELFNLFLANGTRPGDQAAPAEVAEITQQFTFGHTMTLRAPGDPPSAAYQFQPQPHGQPQAAIPGTVSYTFDKPGVAWGVPFVTLSAVISRGDTGFTPSARKADQALLAATAWWPAEDPDIVALAEKITAGASSDQDKARAILKWLAPNTNIKFGGPVVGSRWGVKQVLQQKFGQCWDFADCFVTLARAAGVPCREVAGWLYGSSGHVWVEVLIEGKGWYQLDATGGGHLNCGIYHIPYFTTEDGEMPLLYLSMPKIEIVETKND